MYLASLYAREGNRKKAFGVWKSALVLVQHSAPSIPPVNQPESVHRWQSSNKETIDIKELERYLKNKLGLQEIKHRAILNEL